MRRRMVLRGMGGVAIALPFLEAMAPRRAQAQAARRFVSMFTPNGIIPQQWCSGTETSFMLGQQLQALEPFKNDVVVMHGVFKATGTMGDNHEKGIGAFLTGKELNSGSFSVGGSTSHVGWANGQSVDQVIAGELAKTTTLKLRSLELGVGVLGSGIWDRTVYAGPDKPIAAEISPYAAFNRLFMNLNTNPMDLKKILDQRKSMLDTVLDQFRYVEGKLGAGDKARLQAHEDAIRSIETSLTVATKTSQSCSAPTVGAQMDAKANDNFPMMGKLMMDILAMALACDLTRVVTLQWSASAADPRFTWLGITEGHHSLSHMQTKASPADAYDPSAANEKLLKINTWYGQQFAYLLGKLKTIQDGNGQSLLDGSVVMWGNEISNGPHDLNNLPYVLAGGGWGAKTGRYLVYDRKTPLHNCLLVSALNAMGVPATSFGNPAWGMGPMPRLRS